MARQTIVPASTRNANANSTAPRRSRSGPSCSHSRDGIGRAPKRRSQRSPFPSTTKSTLISRLAAAAGRRTSHAHGGAARMALPPRHRMQRTRRRRQLREAVAEQLRERRRAQRPIHASVAMRPQRRSRR
ncbi:hypothetical protein ACFOPN_18700 [Xanthomonas hyacinthi]|uniref:hypothetical protein n=1 Tax=Xanthomonas hyacinthi TaxID=56455 RepID=UPI00062D7CF8|nr:hypothetical protein [Xanthomonas hyacinthi]KLD77087.1 hypothetical protein Y886_17700 [Xanthomonas hyacinthi DSM 19077]